MLKANKNTALCFGTIPDTKRSPAQRIRFESEQQNKRDEPGRGRLQARTLNVLKIKPFPALLIVECDRQRLTLRNKKSFLK